MGNIDGKKLKAETRSVSGDMMSILRFIDTLRLVTNLFERKNIDVGML